MTWLSVFLFEWLGPGAKRGLLYRLEKVSEFYRLYSKDPHRLTKLTVIMTWFFLFFGINLSMLSSSMKTNQVIIDGTEFIDSKLKLETTSRYGCWFTEDTIYKFVANSEKDSWLYQLLKKRKKPDKEVCMMDQIFINPNLIQQSAPELTKIFWACTKSLAFFLMSLFSKAVSRKIIFTASFLDYELVQIHYIAKALDSWLKAPMQTK